MSDNYKNWLKRSKSNLKLAKSKKDKDICYEDLCFEAQQCAEKALKALLIYFNAEVPKTHSFNILLEKLEANLTIIPDEFLDVLELNDYAVQTRYPGDYTPLDDEEYKRAVAIAGKLLNSVIKIIKK
ncbi:MAG: HEPN domain-containing protein [Spirochaetes bacterium]|nr:HEPN domain-containing protein [Spirochaetota bacterium]